MNHKKSLGWGHNILVYVLVETVKCRTYNWAVEFKKNNKDYSKHASNQSFQSSHRNKSDTRAKTSAHIMKFRLSVLGHWMYTVCVTLTWKSEKQICPSNIQIFNWFVSKWVGSLGRNFTMTQQPQINWGSHSDQICPGPFFMISLPLNKHLLEASSVWGRDDLWQSVKTVSAPSASANFFALWTFRRSNSCGTDRMVRREGAKVTAQDFGGLFLMKLILRPFFICPNGITRFSPPIYLLALLSPTWEGQTPSHGSDLTVLQSHIRV